MKKLIPLVLFVLLAFAGCNRGPVVYKVAERPNQVAPNAEEFAEQTAKRAKHYSAEDWGVAIEQFTAMCKDYKEKKMFMNQDDVIRYKDARLDFIKSVDLYGNLDLALQIKEIYSEIMDD